MIPDPLVCRNDGADGDRSGGRVSEREGGQEPFFAQKTVPDTLRPV